MSELSAVMAAVNDLNKSHGVVLNKKNYTEVAKRVEAFRTHFGLKYAINTNIIVDDGKRVIIKAQIFDMGNPTIAVGEGYGEEIRGSSNVNKTSAIENCETSAIGRALASCGLHGGQYASVNEIDKAGINEKNINEQHKSNKQESKVDWTLYIAKQQEAITKMKTLTALSSWTNNEAKNLENLAAADKPKWTALFNFWSAKNEEIKNG